MQQSWSNVVPCTHGFRISTAGTVHWSEIVRIINKRYKPIYQRAIGCGSAAMTKVVVHGIVERLEVVLVIAARILSGGGEVETVAGREKQRI